MDNVKKWRTPVLIVFLLLGFLISVQFHAQQVFQSDLSLQSTDTLTQILKGLHDKRDKLDKEMQDLEQQQQAISSDTTSGASLVSNLTKESNQLEIALGTDPGQGPGDHRHHTGRFQHRLPGPGGYHQRTLGLPGGGDQHQRPAGHHLDHHLLEQGEDDHHRQRQRRHLPLYHQGDRQPGHPGCPVCSCWEAYLTTWPSTRSIRWSSGQTNWICPAPPLRPSAISNRSRPLSEVPSQIWVVRNALFRLLTSCSLTSDFSRA